MAALHRRAALRPRRLAACLALALAISPAATGSPFPRTALDPLPRAMAEYERTTGRTLAAMRAAPSGTPGVVHVTSCDDAGPGSLRDAVAIATDTDVIDLTHLACSRITLTTGALAVTEGRLVLIGPGADKLTIDGGGHDRIIDHANDWAVRVQGLTLTGGATDGDGGCVRSAGMVHLYDAIVSDCHAAGRGGAVFASTQFFMYRSTISDSTSAISGAAGGGAYSESGFTGLVQSTLARNAATSGRGGGIHVRDTFYLSRSTLDSNDALQGGGFASDVDDDALVNVAGSTISSNTAVRGAGFDVAGDLRLVDSTLALNAASVSGGGFYATQAIAMQNTIAANNSPSDIAGGGNATIAGANNLVIASALTLPADTLHADPLLEPLALHGGLTMTHALPSGSPAVDHGNNQSFMRYDQRYHGSARTIGAAPDIGAYELQTIGTTIAATNCLDAGEGSLREAVAQAKSGDTIDLSKLACGAIALTSAIEIEQGTLTIAGPGASALVLDGGALDRVIDHETYGTLVLSAITLTHGRAALDNAGGGCVRAYSTLVLRDATVDACYATAPFTSSGGGIYATRLVLERSRVTNNLSMTLLTATAGGIAVAGDFTMQGSTVSGNRAVTTYDHAEPKASSSGGGILVGRASRVEISGSTISGNYAGNEALGLPGYFGGIGIYGSYFVPALIENTTISGNFAASFNGGLFATSTLTLRNSTIAFNRAGTVDAYRDAAATGVHTTAPWLDLSSTIIAGSSGGPEGATDLGGAPETFGANNLVTTSAVPLPPDTIFDDPALLPLADNGGATLTHALSETSPALDAGNNHAGLANDQRGAGFGRTAGARTDIGAFELQVKPPDRVFADGFDG